jgi:hypothetical protein
MTTKARDAASVGGVQRSEHAIQVRPIRHGLRARRPEAGLPQAAERGLAYLQFIAGEDDQRLAQELVGYSLRRQSRRQAPFVRTPPFSVLNRRRRVARLWVNAVFAGDVSPATLRSLTQSWLPQLCGTGPEAWRAVHAGREVVEFLRGAFTASVMDEPMACLLRHAKALHAMETTLAIHLGAILGVPRPQQA